jgi:hypothetical protein
MKLKFKICSILLSFIMLSSLSSFTSVNQEIVDVSSNVLVEAGTTVPCKDIPPGFLGNGFFFDRICTDDNNKFLCEWRQHGYDTSIYGTCTISVE